MTAADTTKVLFPKPAFETLKAPPRSKDESVLAVVDDSGEIPYEERLRLLARWRQLGFDERSIVTLPNRPPLFYTSPWNWGIIVNATSARQQDKKWTPFMVRWFSTQRVEDYWPEELVLIHQALSEDDVRDLYEKSEE